MTAPALCPREIRARRRPGVVAATYLLRAAFGVVLAWPVCEIFARRSLAHPRTDAILFDPGGLFLVEAFRLDHAAVLQALRGLSAAAVVVFALGLLPLGALIHALGRGGRLGAADLAAAAMRVFGRFSVLLALTSLAIAFVVLAAMSLAAAIRARIAPTVSDPSADLSVAAAWLVGAALIAVIGVVHDLARAAVSQRDVGVMDAVARAVGVVSAHPVVAVFAWAWRAAAGLALVVGAAFATARLDVEHTAGLVATGLVHQAAVFAVVALRASWLASAIRLSERVAPGGSSPSGSGPEELFVATGRAIPADVEAHDPAP
jgi:hypothetical protein